MKHKPSAAFMTLALMLFGCLTFGQPSGRIKIDVVEKTFSINKQNQNGLEVLIPYADKKTVERELLLFMRSRYNVKGSSRRGVITFNNVAIGQISPRPVDVLARVDGASDGALLQMAFITTDGHVSSQTNAEQFFVASSLVREFGRNQTINALNGRLAEAQRALDAKQKELDNLIKQKASLEKTIRDCQDAISKAENDLKNNAQNQQRAAQDLEQQRAALNALREMIDKVE